MPLVPRARQGQPAAAVSSPRRHRSGAFDVIAMLGTLDVVQGETRALVISNMKSLDEQATSHTWKKELGKAGNGPAQFQELRAFVPRHSPHSHPGWR
jgi:hypothetical protein